MGIQIGAKPDADFSDPIGMLHDCHRRIEHFLNIVCVVVNRAEDRALTDEEKEAIEAALHYFRTGGPRHNADEEESLFPRMRAAGATDQLEKIGGLEHDHREREQLHATIEMLYTEWIANGGISATDHQKLAAATARLQQLYRDHIELEEKVVFPTAATMLNQEALTAMGQEFRARRSKEK